MKKLYRKSTVHPSPPIIADFLSFLPAAILSLTVSLSADEKEVLAYLLSCSASFSNNRKKLGSTGKGGVEHAPLFDCDCFMCYRRYWARWDSSPNRQLIHEIIDAYEDGLLLEKRKNTAKTQRNRRKRKNESAKLDDDLNLNRSEISLGFGKGVLVTDEDSVKKEISCGNEEEEEEGSVRRFVSFVGEKIWSAWG